MSIDLPSRHDGYTCWLRNWSDSGITSALGRCGVSGVVVDRVYWQLRRFADFLTDYSRPPAIQEIVDRSFLVAQLDNKVIAKLTGCSGRTVRRALRILERYDIIRPEPISGSRVAYLLGTWWRLKNGATKRRYFLDHLLSNTMATRPGMSHRALDRRIKLLSEALERRAEKKATMRSGRSEWPPADVEPDTLSGLVLWRLRIAGHDGRQTETLS